ncbi:hypothetical protein [Bifidobacterium sp. SO1]|uniref:hypothetical protein n=1 Tax=Bifidobacterium sp. SO1 TaxID=2809029 RepID=UPI001BDBB64A|nr:hypothetical protein [Bifidobacterium sp. SO1]MBT1162036.1 hypothetical protein [Bifidobacterium sp. SO1]
MLTFAVRNQADEGTAYRPLETSGLAVACRPATAGHEPDVTAYTVNVTNMADTTFRGVVRIDLPLAATISPDDLRFFLPGFMYGRNRGEAPLAVPERFPRMRSGEPSCPASSWWMVRGDRLSNPCALAFDGTRVVGLCASPYLVESGDGDLHGWEPRAVPSQSDDEPTFAQYAGYSCDDGSVSGTPSVGATLGYENAPWLFVSSSNVHERAPLGDNCLILQPGASVAIRLDVFDYPAGDELGIERAIEHTYRRFHQPPRAIGSVESAVRDLSTAVDHDAWLADRHMYAGFVFDNHHDIADRPGKNGIEYQELGSVSWTNGMAAAGPMLSAALRLNDDIMRGHAIDCIDDIVHHSLNPASGLPYDAVRRGAWSNHGWWFERLPSAGHSSYLDGQAVYYILDCYRNELEFRSCAHDDWLDFAGRVITVFERGRNGDDEYPYLFSERTGAGIDYDSFAGAWCLAAGAYWTLITGDRRYLDGLCRSERRYYDAYVRRVECYGAPLDTAKAVDSEGILAYVKAVRRLHEITGDDLYLDHLRDALCYEFTFKFCWNSPVNVPPLSHVGWSSCGGSITSTCNPHIHPMSSNVIGDMDYYLRVRDDEYVRSRMDDTIAWSCQTYNTVDGEYDYGKVGWMSERFCYSQGLLEEHYPNGDVASTWFALMPWAVGSILDGLTGLHGDYGGQ